MHPYSAFHLLFSLCREEEEKVQKATPHKGATNCNDDFKLDFSGRNVESNDRIILILYKFKVCNTAKFLKFLLILFLTSPKCLDLILGLEVSIISIYKYYGTLTPLLTII